MREQEATASRRARGSDEGGAVKTHPYMQIADAIRQRIGRGDYRPGDRLPSESEFCTEFGVSPMTLRRALAVLEDAGVLVAEQGRGTFVRALDLGVATFRLHQITSQWQDGSVDVRLLAASTARASERVAGVLQLPVGRRTVYLRRLLSRRGVPLAYHHEHVVFDARRPLVESQLQITSLEGLLQTSGGDGFSLGRLRMSAVNLDDKAATALGEETGAAALCLEHVFYDFDARPVSWGWFLCRADQVSLETHVGPGHPVAEEAPRMS
jgi:DNA-binding GntR family transcriptional regulator